MSASHDADPCLCFRMHLAIPVELQLFLVPACLQTPPEVHPWAVDDAGVALLPEPAQVVTVQTELQSNRDCAQAGHVVC